MKKQFVKRFIALFMSITLVLVSCAFGTTALESDMDNLFADMEYDNEFYVTQTESIRVYNEMLEAFAEETSTTYSLNSQTAEETYPEYYGGAYIDDNGELVVLVTEMTNPVNSKVRQATDYSSQVSTELCDVSYNEMCYVIDFLTDKMEELRKEGVVIESIRDDIINGNVVITIVNLTYEKEQEIRKIIDCNFLEFENSTGINDEATNVSGGYRITSSTGYSTACFAATRNGQTGLVVSGHAFPSVGKVAYYNGVKIGEVSKTAYKNNSKADASFVHATGNVTITAVLKNGGHIMSGSMLDPPVNSTVYMYGTESGLTSGKITSINVSIKAEDGTTFIAQCLANYASQDGDSGAPILYYEGNYGGKTYYTIRGIHRSSTYAGKSFSPYKNIVDELGITCIVG